MNRLIFAGLAIGLVLMTAALRAQEGDTSSQDAAATIANPIALLVRDGAVRAELRLTLTQVQGIDALLAELNEPLFALRDGTPEQKDLPVRQFMTAFESRLWAILTPQQKARLEGLVVQAQGWQALLRPEIAKRLNLTSAQRDKLMAIFDETRAALKDLQKEAANGGAAETLQKTQRLQTSQHEKVAALLTDRQRRAWLELVGEKFDLTKVRQSPGKAPELRDVSAWLNSEPLDFEQLRGRVVVLHFFAFGCINCIHNYPSYRDWQERFAKQDVTIIGIHTPETQAERRVETLQTKLTDNKLDFAVAVDLDQKNWNAWSNRWWPSVYLVDRQGNVRYWWYGELNWQGAEGEKIMRGRIEELLKEK
jgi:peroxiredoxin